MTDAGVVANGLTLARGWRTLVSGLSFAVAPGAGLQLRGPNGSGKTTLLRALAGLHQPQAGTITVLGESHEGEAATRIAYLGHLDAIKPAEAVRAQLAFWAALAGAPASAITDAAAQTGISRQLDLPGGVLSAGQRRRLALARILLSRRPVWLLDEPAAPLDAAGREMLGTLLDAHREAGGIVIAAVHDEPPGGPFDRLDLAP